MRKIAFSIADSDFHLIQNDEAETNVFIVWDESIKRYIIEVKKGDAIIHKEKRNKDFTPA